MRSIYLLTILAFSSFLLLCQNTQAQSTLVERGENAFYLGGGFSGGDNVNSTGGDHVNAIGAGLGYAKGGLLGGGIELSRLIFGDSDLKGTEITPAVFFTPIRQSPSIPIAISLSANYSVLDYSSGRFAASGLNLSGSSFGAGANIFSNISIGPTADFVPSFGFGYISGSSKLEDKFGIAIKTNVNGIGYDLTAGFRFNTSASSFFFILPNVFIFKDKATFALTVGMGLGKTRTTGAVDLARSMELEDRTALPNFRRANPQFNKYSDNQILALYRKKYPRLQGKSDIEVIKLIEAQHSRKR